ncbi:MAG TPA: hypothetical protein VK963_02650 [Candidatus Saccharimonadales bacterium]|nr:hypothetical protein [Candidatus Saccharimonadales bacterium]
MTAVVSTDYFAAKQAQSRKEVSDTSGKAFEAQEIATQVLRLCYPLRQVTAVHAYYNNSPMKPFVRAEHPNLKGHHGGLEKMKKSAQQYVVVDIYFLFGGAYVSKSEEEAFVVEVAFPLDTERARWASLARVRWADLGWLPNDSPVPQLTGETFVNAWM